MDTIKRYYWLAKPGIVYSNMVAAMAGFLLATSHKGQFDAMLFITLDIGIGLVMASACVLNNYIDRDIDRKMKRTKTRPTANGLITKQAAIIYTVVLGAVGFCALLYTNSLTVFLGLIAYVAYIVLYGIAKRKTVHGTLVGTISGALPPVAGYVTVTGKLDTGALLLFLIFVCWQMPHFYAIAMRRRADYATAGIPVLPVVYGMRMTKVQILAYTSLFIVFNGLLVAYGYVHYTYLVVMTVTGTIWLIKGTKGFKSDDDQQWAKRMFLFSLIVLLTTCAMIAVGGLLP